MSRFTDASLVVVPSLYKASKLYAIKPGTGLADFAVTRSSVKWVLGPNGVLRSVAANTPALEYNTDRTFKGMLVEPAATNGIRNNTMVGAVAGTPGTLPTNYSQTLNGLIREVVGVGTENGVDYIDLRFSGTATGTNVDIAFETSTGIVATPSQIWTVSAWLKVVSAPTPPLSYQFRVFSATSLGVGISGTGSTIQSVTGTLARFSETITSDANATTARVIPNIRANVTNGETYDFTIRIGLPQMETGAVATSVIKTSGSTQTRTADAITLAGASSLIGATEGTLYAEITLPDANGVTSVFPRVLVINSTSGQNRVVILSRIDGTKTMRLQLFANNVAIYTKDILNQVGTLKIAHAYKTGDSNFYINGTAVSTPSADAFTFTETIDNIGLGNQAAGATMTGWIRSVALFPERRPNAELEALTTL